MGKDARKMLVIGYGNPCRLDDGLGPALAAGLEKLGLPGVTVEADAQLVIEDAGTVVEHDVVIFADASLAGPGPFTFQRIEPRAGAMVGSHIVEPEAVLALAREVFAVETEAYVLGIRGYEFDGFGEALSEQATANLAAALEFVERVIREGNFRQAEAQLNAALSTENGPSGEEKQ